MHGMTQADDLHKPSSRNQSKAETGWVQPEIHSHESPAIGSSMSVKPQTNCLILVTQLPAAKIQRSQSNRQKIKTFGKACERGPSLHLQ